jgi:hypothetical protein
MYEVTSVELSPQHVPGMHRKEAHRKIAVMLPGVFEFAFTGLIQKTLKIIFRNIILSFFL